MGEVESLACVSSTHKIACGLSYLALGQLRLDRRPSLTLCSVTEQVHDDCAFGDSLVHLEQVFAWDPAILFSFLPGCAVLADTNDHI